MIKFAAILTLVLAALMPLGSVQTQDLSVDFSSDLLTRAKQAINLASANGSSPEITADKLAMVFAAFDSMSFTDDEGIMLGDRFYSQGVQRFECSKTESSLYGSATVKWQVYANADRGQVQGNPFNPGKAIDADVWVPALSLHFTPDSSVFAYPIHGNRRIRIHIDGQVDLYFAGILTHQWSVVLNCIQHV